MSRDRYVCVTERRCREGCKSEKCHATFCVKFGTKEKEARSRRGGEQRGEQKWDTSESNVVVMAKDKGKGGSEEEPRRSGIAREGTKGTNRRERKLDGGNKRS
jgi:hypothetical protein